MTPVAERLVSDFSEYLEKHLPARLDSDFLQRIKEEADKGDIKAVQDLSARLGKGDELGEKLRSAFDNINAILAEYGAASVDIPEMIGTALEGFLPKQTEKLLPRRGKYISNAQIVAVKGFLGIVTRRMKGGFEAVAPSILRPEYRTDKKALASAVKMIRYYKMGFLKQFENASGNLEETVGIVVDELLLQQEEGSAMSELLTLVKANFGGIKVRELRQKFNMRWQRLQRSRGGSLFPTKEVAVSEPKDKDALEVIACSCFLREGVMLRVQKLLGTGIEIVDEEGKIISEEQSIRELLERSRIQAAEKRENKPLSGEDENNFRKYFEDLRVGESFVVADSGKSRVGLELLYLVIKRIKSDPIKVEEFKKMIYPCVDLQVDGLSGFVIS